MRRIPCAADGRRPLPRQGDPSSNLPQPSRAVGQMWPRRRDRLVSVGVGGCARAGLRCRIALSSSERYPSLTELPLRERRAAAQRAPLSVVEPTSSPTVSLLSAFQPPAVGFSSFAPTSNRPPDRETQRSLESTGDAHGLPVRRASVQARGRLARSARPARGDALLWIALRDPTEEEVAAVQEALELSDEQAERLLEQPSRASWWTQASTCM